MIKLQWKKYATCKHRQKQRDRNSKNLKEMWEIGNTVTKMKKFKQTEHSQGKNQ